MTKINQQSYDTAANLLQKSILYFCPKFSAIVLVGNNAGRHYKALLIAIFPV